MKSLDTKQLSPLAKLNKRERQSHSPLLSEEIEMGEETIKKILKNSGLTANEADIYILLAKQGAMNRSEVARSLKKDKAQVSRILKKLQSKGIVESTLEFPRRFTVIPFEKIIDQSIRTKREEVTFIENAKRDLLKYLEKTRQAGLKTPPEKFLVIEGNQKIYSKISDMLRETKRQLSAVSTVKALVKSSQFNLVDFSFNYDLKSHAKFRFLTDFSDQDVNAGKALLDKKPMAGFEFRVRNPDVGLRLFPRMVIRDDEEILLFIKSRTDNASEGREVSLWTNCKSIIQSFTCVFEELWGNSLDLQTKITETEAGEVIAVTSIAPNARKNEELYEKTVRLAEKEIMMLTSARDLVKLWQKKALIEEWMKSGVSVKIMAPITKENSKVAEQLSRIFRVRHVAVSQLATTIIDGKHLFQFKISSPDKEETRAVSSFANVFYSNKIEYISKVKIMVDDIWRNAHSLKHVSLKSVIQPSKAGINAFSQESYTLSRLDSPYQRMTIPFTEKPRVITEKEVLDKIKNATKIHVKNLLKDKAMFYGSRAAVAIHPPDYLNLPEMMMSVSHWNEKSSFGAENWLTIQLLIDTQNGDAFVPVAFIKNNPKGLDFIKMIYTDTPATKNIQVVEQEELQVRAYENILFAGWTKPIPLLTSKYTLPPSCVLFEGYGEVKSGIIKSGFKHGRKQTWEYNGLEAFVTYFHPSMKYSGPGTDGTLSREVILTSYPPKQ